MLLPDTGMLIRYAVAWNRNEVLRDNLIPPLQDRSLFLIGHSLGGLVIKRVSPLKYAIIDC